MFHQFPGFLINLFIIAKTENCLSLSEQISQILI